MPELRALQQNLVGYELAAAAERQARDLLVATWRDVLHSGMKMSTSDLIRVAHQVMNNMDEFLKRSKK